MAQPFESRVDGYSQRLSESEISSGSFALNMAFYDRLKKRSGEGESISAKVDELDTIQLHLDIASTSMIGGDQLRLIFKGWKLQQGSTLDVQISNVGMVSISPNTQEPMTNDRSIATQTEVKKMNSATNLILYGPPGTGKTYKTAQIAVALCNGSANTNRELLMQEYEGLRKEGRISFVTFHQSYGYEEFVEGLRPEVKEGQVAYSVRPGVFREICSAAKRSQLVKPGLSGKPFAERKVFKMSLGVADSAEGKLAFQDSISNGVVLLGWGDDIDFSDCEGQAAMRARLEEVGGHENPESQSRYMSVFKNELSLGDLIVVSQGNNAFRAIGEVTGDYEFLEAPLGGRYHQSRPVRWIAVFEGNRPVEEIYSRRFMQSTLYKLQPEYLKSGALEGLINLQREIGKKDFVLVIDEINRANISKVFGELITLLEPDKRDGEINAITLKLPYSGTEFSVPANLHIIGTMNTADRSIALLDTALRRRFEFEELAPDPTTLAGTVIDGIDLEKLLAALNERVEALFDRDHRIGHAFFIGISSLEGLEQVFRRKVIPLLQEYFYENWSNVRRALNDYGSGDFVVSAKLAQLQPDGEESFSDEPRVVYRVNEAPFPLTAYRRIYGWN